MGSSSGGGGTGPDQNAQRFGLLWEEVLIGNLFPLSREEKHSFSLKFFRILQKNLAGGR